MVETYSEKKAINVDYFKTKDVTKSDSYAAKMRAQGYDYFKMPGSEKKVEEEISQVKEARAKINKAKKVLDERQGNAEKREVGMQADLECGQQDNQGS